MSRNKENNPQPSSERAERISLSFIKTPPSEDFFTDSLLDASKIPTPSPKKHNFTKPRSANGTNRTIKSVRDAGSQPRQAATSERLPTRDSRKLQPSPNLGQKKSQSPLRTHLISTPPKSNANAPLKSPTADVASPPPRGLDDVYQRIADEEDLAATEAELDSDEEYEEEALTGSTDPNINQPDIEQVGKPASSTRSRSSLASTPIQHLLEMEKENIIDDRGETMSEASGLSFLRDLTDQDLAAKLTPHTIDRAKDKARFHRALNSQRPIIFNKPGTLTEENSRLQPLNGESINMSSHRKPAIFSRASRLALTRPEKAYSDTSTEEHAPKKLHSFSRAGKIRASRVPEEDGDSDTDDELKRRERVIAFQRAARTLGGALGKKQAGPDTTSQNTQERRDQAESRSNQKSQPVEHSPVGAIIEDYVNASYTAPNALSSRNFDVGQSHRVSTEARRESDASSDRSYLRKWRQQTADLRKQGTDIALNGSPGVDWAAAAADVPLPSVESTSTPQTDTSATTSPVSLREKRSADRIKRWENDFTGLSFQVSESPPVRPKPSAAEYVRDKEIQNLNKQALTTNRLGEIFSKLGQEQSRKASRSPSSGQTELINQEPREVSPSSADIPMVKREDVNSISPVLVSRPMTSESLTKLESKDVNLTTHSEQSSHEYLQRLARATSNSARSSPTTDSKIQSIDNFQSKEPPRLQAAVETPRISGAWTDTILPETVQRTVRPEKQPKYTQTPHVSAGAWVDTPLTRGKRHPAVIAPTIPEELTEELVGDVKATEEMHNELVSVAKANDSNDPEQIQKPQSALENIVSRAKLRNLSLQEDASAPEDTLNLGDATIASLEDLMTLDADDLTALIRLGAEQELTNQNEEDFVQSETQLLERLGTKLEKLRTNIHDARKGISKLEQQVSQPVMVMNGDKLVSSQITDLNMCQVCGRLADHNHETLVFPFVFARLTLPIPLLFYPRRTDLGHRFPRPTVFGWLITILWIWYLTECTLCELYSHPLYAEHYVWPKEPEPVFPYALPTMLWRWSSLENIIPWTLGPFWRLVVAFSRVIGMWLGVTDGFVDDLRGVGNSFFSSATKAAMNAATQSVMPASAMAGTGPDLSMMNDEFI